MTTRENGIEQAFEEFAFLYDFDLARVQPATRSGKYASEKTKGAWLTWAYLASALGDAFTPQPSPLAAPMAEGCKEQCWACAESGIGCNLLNDGSPAAPPAAQAVAWMFASITGGYVFYEGASRPEGAPERAIPLYAHPPTAQVAQSTITALREEVERLTRELF